MAKASYKSAAEKNANRERSKIRNKIIKDMKKTGIYNDSFVSVIEDLAELIFFKQKLYANIIDSDFEFSIETQDGSRKSNPEFSQYIQLSKDIKTYSNELGLTPKGLKSLQEEEQEKVVSVKAVVENSGLEEILKQIKK